MTELFRESQFYFSDDLVSSRNNPDKVSCSLATKRVRVELVVKYKVYPNLEVFISFSYEVS